MAWGEDEHHAQQMLIEEYSCSHEQVYDLMDRLFGDRYGRKDRRGSAGKYTVQRFRDEWTQRSKPSEPWKLWQRIEDPKQHTDEDKKIREQLRADITVTAMDNKDFNYLTHKRNCKMRIRCDSNPLAEYLCSGTAVCVCPQLPPYALSADQAPPTTLQPLHPQQSAHLPPHKQNPAITPLQLVHTDDLIAPGAPGNDYYYPKMKAQQRNVSDNMYKYGGIVIKVVDDRSGKVKEACVMCCDATVCGTCKGMPPDSVQADQSPLDGYPFVHLRRDCRPAPTKEKLNYQYTFVGFDEIFPRLPADVEKCEGRKMVRFTDDTGDRIALCLTCDPGDCDECQDWGDE